MPSWRITFAFTPHAGTPRWIREGCPLPRIAAQAHQHSDSSTDRRPLDGASGSVRGSSLRRLDPAASFLSYFRGSTHVGTTPARYTGRER